jgi:hypothetical protein
MLASRSSKDNCDTEPKTRAATTPRVELPRYAGKSSGDPQHHLQASTPSAVLRKSAAPTE